MVEADSIPIIDAAPYRKPSKAGDVVAFWMSQTVKAEPLALAKETPKPGTRIWLAASVLEGAHPSQRLHSATVTNDDEGGLLFYEFHNADLSLQATSGAPMVDKNGHVVAINLAGGKQDGRLFGAGNPVGRFWKSLEEAAAASNR